MILRRMRYFPANAMKKKKRLTTDMATLLLKEVREAEELEVLAAAIFPVPFPMFLTTFLET